MNYTCLLCGDAAVMIEQEDGGEHASTGSFCPGGCGHYVCGKHPVGALCPEDLVRLFGQALEKVNEIRNSIIGLQTMNWSEHIYPLVAALDFAGFKGMGWIDGKKHYGTMLERTVTAEKELAELRARSGEAS